MQYYSPPGTDAFAGDAMPFYHDGVFHLYYLLDRGHHQSLGGLGGHQWAHTSTRDLVHWEHHPLALAITEPWEGSICTGSVFHNEGTYYAFYATRRPDWTQHLAMATSEDAVHFQKHPQLTLASLGSGYSPYHCRDPFVFRGEASGVYHMLVTSMLASPELEDYGGCLAHLTSPDLRAWERQEPFLVSGYPGAPECPDLFTWNGWTYLIFSHDLVAHYRMACSPLGPWIRPPVDTFDGPMASVMKTAPFGPDRRIGVAWVGTREGDRDSGRRQWGGNLVIRELVQRADGTLGTCFPAEVIPKTQSPLPQAAVPLTAGARCIGRTVELAASQGIQAAMLENVPHDVRITMQVRATSGTLEFGLRLRGTGAFRSGCDLRFSPQEAVSSLGCAGLHLVSIPDRAFTVEVVAIGDIIDVCIDHDRCLVNRLPEAKGDRLFFYCHEGHVTFDEVTVQPIEAEDAHSEVSR